MIFDFFGIKKSLIVSINVELCNIYSFKFVIVDWGDFFYDFGVFVFEFKGGILNLIVQFNFGIDYFVEDCVN